MSENVKYFIPVDAKKEDYNSSNKLHRSRVEAAHHATISFYESEIEKMGYECGTINLLSPQCIIGWVIDVKELKYIRIEDNSQTAHFTTLEQLQKYTESIKHRVASKKFGL